MNWHQSHKSQLTIGDRIADHVASIVGSWKFIITQTVIICAWIVGNVYLFFHFDPFPFIFLNLAFSAQAAYATPIIMMAQNRAADRDRHQAEADYATNLKAKEEIEQLILKLEEIDTQKLDAIILNLRALMSAFNTEQTTDETLHRIAIEAVLLSRPGMITKIHAKTPHKRTRASVR